MIQGNPGTTSPPTQSAIWLSDIHLDFAQPGVVHQFLISIKEHPAAQIWISGDVAQAGNISGYLTRMESSWARPIYFVLGNHDFYMSSFRDVRSRIRKLCANLGGLCWLCDSGVIELSPNAGLIGHDSWADGRFGDYKGSELLLNDYLLIRDFNPWLRGADGQGARVPAGAEEMAKAIVGPEAKQRRLSIMQGLAQEAVAHVEKHLPAALERYQRVFFLTHPPPFKAACWHDGRISDDNGLPHFSCKAVGDALVHIMKRHPDKHLTVLCGHTHSGATAQILGNLVVHTAQATYGRPEVQRIIAFGD